MQLIHNKHYQVKKVDFRNSEYFYMKVRLLPELEKWMKSQHIKYKLKPNEVFSKCRILFDRKDHEMLFKLTWV